ncbi:Membrane protein [Agrococcus casei LMG 22410]|uniref:Membrane protein n=1 Tax=Agrococcus casei LMG 22410 TaxID=1255656 RepID=A0A1R4G9R0_9MICO|nr:Membrane protein [Agrococcus casei LMG 22410]
MALVYALFDLSFTDRSRIRRLNRPLWFLIVIVLPIVGPLLWVMWGKRSASAAAEAPVRGDDDPRFGSSAPAISTEETDQRIREIEEQLEALEAEEAAERERLAAESPESDEPDARHDEEAPAAADEAAEADAAADTDDDAQRTDRGNGGQLGA